MMNIADYWNEKTALLEKAFEGWQRKEEIQVRKLVIAKVMNIPAERIAYYLKQNEMYRDFALGNDSEMDYASVEKDYIKEKVQNIINDYFYEKDYEELCKIENALEVKEKPRKRKAKEEQENGKKKVCEFIKKLVDDDVYNKLSGESKSKVDTLEKIYFDSVDLFNEYVEESVGSNTYTTMLLEQWKTANEMAANISAQRNNMNNFYMSLMSILIGGIVLSDKLFDTGLLFRSVFYLVVMVFGVVCCIRWISQIENFKRLNNEKYEIINRMERKLPANVLLYEYLHTEQSVRKGEAKVNLSEQEKGIAKLFLWTIIALSLLLLIYTWKENIWAFIQMFFTALKS